MASILLILLTFILCLGLGLGSYLYFHNRKIRMNDSYLLLLNEFFILSKSNTTVLNNRLIQLGEELVYHPCLTGRDLNKLYNICLDLERKYPELKELKLKAYNKKLYFDRHAEAAPY